MPHFVFPDNPFVRRLVRRAQAMGIAFEASPLPQQWMYHPGRRAILLWPPDLHGQSLSYLVVILAHELGHAADFDRHPQMAGRLHEGNLRRYLAMERSAFINGFLLLQELGIPVTPAQYVAMIEHPMDAEVARALNTRLCSLLEAPCRQAPVDCRPTA